MFCPAVFTFLARSFLPPLVELPNVGRADRSCHVRESGCFGWNINIENSNPILSFPTLGPLSNSVLYLSRTPQSVFLLSSVLVLSGSSRYGQKHGKWRLLIQLHVPSIRTEHPAMPSPLERVQVMNESLRECPPPGQQTKIGLPQMSPRHWKAC